MKLAVRMIFNVIFYKNLRFIRIFNPDLRQYRIKFSLFTSRNPDFLHFHAVVFFKCTDWSLEKIRQLSGATQACSRSPTNVQNNDSRPNGCNIRLIVETITTSHTGTEYHVKHNVQGMPPHHGFSLLINVGCARVRASGPSPAVGQWSPVLPFEICALPFHVWPPGCCIHPIQFFEMWPPFWFLAPPAAKSWRQT